jgi:hypothetical protein
MRSLIHFSASAFVLIWGGWLELLGMVEISFVALGVVSTPTGDHNENLSVISVTDEPKNDACDAHS